MSIRPSLATPPFGCWTPVAMRGTCKVTRRPNSARNTHPHATLPACPRPIASEAPTPWEAARLACLDGSVDEVCGPFE